jgi:hypothetical protein
MKSVGSSVFPFVFALLFSFLWATSAHTHQSFLQCLTLRSENSTSITKLIYTQDNSSYSCLAILYTKSQILNTCHPKTSSHSYTIASLPHPSSH